jgi:hypothetical protein
MDFMAILSLQLMYAQPVTLSLQIVAHVWLEVVSSVKIPFICNLFPTRTLTLVYQAVWQGITPILPTWSASNVGLPTVLNVQLSPHVPNVTRTSTRLKARVTPPVLKGMPQKPSTVSSSVFPARLAVSHAQSLLLHAPYAVTTYNQARMALASQFPTVVCQLST